MTNRIATAEWAHPSLVEEKFGFRDGDVWLGRSPSDRQLPIGYQDDRHVCLVSGSRGGKGTSSVINNLCLWRGSVIVVDPKGENATVTVPRRGKGSANCEGLGQSVHVLDPFRSAEVDDSYRSRFNPLDALDPESEETIDEAGRIADALVVIHEDSKDPFWDESARAMVKGLILHILTAEEYAGRRNLITLRKLIMRGDWEAVEALRQAGETDIPPAHGLLWTRVSGSSAFGGLVAGIGDTFTNMLMSSPKQFESVLQVANRNTEFIDSPAMQRCLEGSDFDLSGLKAQREGMSLYLCLPQRYMSTHYRWLRMIIALTVTEMEMVRCSPATGFPVLMVLDEFAGLKRMEVIEHAVAQIAGHGVKMFFVLQSLEQLKAAYKDNWETFLSNSGLKVFFNLEDHFSREYVSKLVGETELVREVRSASESESESESESHSVGSSVTQGRSVSEGTNRSATDSESTGVNSSTTKSKGRSWGESWTPSGFMHLGRENRQESRGRNWSKSRTEGTSRGRSHSETDGTSRGISESEGETSSETSSTTHGMSRSRTTGASETIHRRALIHPDEVGRLFASIGDRGNVAYPGVALVLIAGQMPVVIRRVNYYEDPSFMRCFEPRPDHALPGMQEYEVQVPLDNIQFVDDSSSYLCVWNVKSGDTVSRGQPLGSIKCSVMLPGIDYIGIMIDIQAPYTGVISTLRDCQDSIYTGGKLFSLRCYERGEQAAHPFPSLKQACDTAALAHMKFSLMCCAGILVGVIFAVKSLLQLQLPTIIGWICIAAIPVGAGFLGKFSWRKLFKLLDLQFDPDAAKLIAVKSTNTGVVSKAGAG